MYLFDGWMGGWMDGWTDGWMGAPMKLKNKKCHYTSEVERSSILRVPPLGGLISKRCEDP